MNLLVLYNNFWAKRLECSWSVNDIAVYFALVDTCNQLHWKNPFNFSVEELQAKLRLKTKDPLDTARNRLKQAGLIDYRNGQGRGHTTQYMLIDPEAPLKKGGKKREKNTTFSPPFSPPFSPTFSPPEKPTVHQTKTKPNQTGANAPSVGGEVEGEGGATFNEWRQWCADNAPEVLKLKTQLTAEQLDKLYAEYGRPLVFEVFEAMQNKAGLTKAYTSVYLTAKTWCKRRAGDVNRRQASSQTTAKTVVPDSLAEKVHTQSKRRVE